jgi:peptide/nickel transport system substrate-binding protein
MSLVNGTDSGFSYYAFNLRRKPLDDQTFRQAVAFMYDDYFWVQRLMAGYVWKGDFVQSNGYPVPRPDYQFASEDQMLTHPATNAFDFRSEEEQSPVPDVEGVRSFLTNGEVIDGSQGTYVGKDYPGSLSGVSASRSESKYDYSFGPVQSQVLRQFDGADKEIRVDGKTIPEAMGGEPITMFIDPPKQGPKEAKAIQRWVENLKSVGIPVKTQALSFNTMTSKVYYQEDFDMYPMGWGGTGPFGSSAYSFFHSDNADDHSKAESEGAQKNADSFMYNSTGYGLYGGSADELLGDARRTMNAEERNKLTARAVEKIYLDAPYLLRDYAKFRWPLNTQKFAGAIPDIVDPAYANFGAQVNNLHLNE